MRYGILADIHSNLEALEAVLAELDKRSVDEILCLGDIVGYGADPAECVRIIRERCRVIVCGNHDYAVFNDKILKFFKPAAKEAVLWTRNALSEEDREFLGGLPLKKSMEDMLLVHAAPLFPEEWEYVSNPEDARRNFNCFDEKMCFLGHSHVPAVFGLNEEVDACRISNEPVSFFSPRMRYIINPGSAGQPRDGNPDASFAVFDSSRRELKIIRVAYDVKTAAKKIIESGLPGVLARRLGAGA